MVKQKKLPNGITLLKVAQKDTEAVTVLILFKVGSRYETKDVNGVSHFIEHLMFKGTKKRPSTLALSKELDRVGAEFNAFTGKDYTGYYIKISRENQELAIDMLSDMLNNSLFEDEEIQKEKGVIIEEINMYEDNPLLYCEDLLEELLFHKEHSLGRLISGPKKTIKNIKRTQILNYKNKYYFPKNMLIAVAGKIDRQTDSLLQKYFNNSDRSKSPVKFQKFQSYQSKPQIVINSRKSEQVQFGLGFEGLPYKHQDLPALSMLSIILGGNMSSRMFINIREKLGLCYFINASLSIYQDTGIFMVRAGLDKTRIYEAIKLILAELEKIKGEGVTKDELENAKTYLKGKISLDLEDSESQASWYAKQKLLSDELKSPKQKLRDYYKVTNKDIQRVANRILNFNKSNLVLIGPFNKKHENKFLNIINNYAK